MEYALNRKSFAELKYYAKNLGIKKIYLLSKVELIYVIRQTIMQKAAVNSMIKTEKEYEIFLFHEFKGKRSEDDKGFLRNKKLIEIKRPLESLYYYVGPHQQDRYLYFDDLTEKEKEDVMMDIWSKFRRTDVHKFVWIFRFEDLEYAFDESFDAMAIIEEDPNEMLRIQDMIENIKQTGLFDAVVGSRGNHRKVAYKLLGLACIPLLEYLDL